MADAERENSHYHPSGIPLTPQARRLGFVFPVYISRAMWRVTCSMGEIKSKRCTSTDRRINELLVACHEGMLKRMAVSDDFVFYKFKHWHWSAHEPERSKKTKTTLGARLLIDPSTEEPWMYIFDPYVDHIDALEEE